MRSRSKAPNTVPSSSTTATIEYLAAGGERSDRRPGLDEIAGAHDDHGTHGAFPRRHDGRGSERLDPRMAIEGRVKQGENGTVHAGE
jgi:hypothetical protein